MKTDLARQTFGFFLRWSYVIRPTFEHLQHPKYSNLYIKISIWNVPFLSVGLTYDYMSFEASSVSCNG